MKVSDAFRARRVLTLLTAGIALVGITAPAGADRLIPFQARLSDASGAAVPNGVYELHFSLYDTATGGLPLNGWTEPHSTVSIVEGQLNVVLGAITSLDDPDANGDSTDAISFAAADGPRYLGITVGVANEMVPRHQILPYFHSVFADGAADSALFDGQPASYYATDSALGAVSQQLQAEVAQLLAVIDQALPPGSVIPFAGSVAPTGYLLCDGTAYQKDDYPELQAVLCPGNDCSTWGGGGATFDVPNLNGRVIMGAGSYFDPVSGPISRTLGDAVGAEKHTLTIPEMPPHSHSFTGKFWFVFSTGSQTAWSDYGPGTNFTKNTDANGGGASHNNVQPSSIMNYIIKF